MRALVNFVVASLASALVLAAGNTAASATTLLFDDFLGGEYLFHGILE